MIGIVLYFIVYKYKNFGAFCRRYRVELDLHNREDEYDIVIRMFVPWILFPSLVGLNMNTEWILELIDKMRQKKTESTALIENEIGAYCLRHFISLILNVYAVK